MMPWCGVQYGKTVRGTFLSRPNRFIADVEVDGKVETVHVKNTGRCREILIPGTTVVLEDSGNPSRKTRYDLIAAYKGDNLINIDSQSPNRAFVERCVSEGYEAYIALIVQMKGMREFVPDYDIHREFGEEMERAESMGVKVLVYDCVVTEDSMTVDSPLPHRYVHS